MVIISFFVLRKKKPEMPRPYRVPFYPFTPVIAIFGSVLAFLFSLLAFESLAHWIIFIGATVLGLIYYLVSVRTRKIS